MRDASKKRVIAAQHGEGVFAQFGEVCCGTSAKALQDAFEEGIEHEEFLGEAIAQSQARTIGEDQG